MFAAVKASELIDALVQLTGYNLNLPSALVNSVMCQVGIVS
jgi:hypothetical protein